MPETALRSVSGSDTRAGLNNRSEAVLKARAITFIFIAFTEMARQVLVPRRLSTPHDLTYRQQAG
jgi:hypothetical protein